jgi:tetratricopeptide (TPR) repeat protein
LILWFALGFAPLEEEAIELNNEAVKLLDEGKHDLAITKLIMAHNLEPDSKAILQNLAAAYAKRGVHAGKVGNLHAAVEDLKAAIRRVPEDSQYRYFIAIYHYRLGALPLAEEQVGRALKLTPNRELRAKLRKLKGNILYLGDRLDEAYAVFQALLLDEPGDAECARMADKIRREKAIQRDYHNDITTYFKLFYDKSALKLNRQNPLILLLEKERSRVCADFNHFPRNRITVIVYNPKDFKTVTESDGWVGGIFDRKIRIPLSEVNNRQDAIAQVVRHEYTHVIVYELAPGCPAWINEGLACYEQYSRGEGAERMKMLFKEKLEPIPFERIPHTFMETSDHHTVGQYYIQSHSMMEFLINRYGLGKIRLLLRELGKEGHWMKAFRTAFNRDFETVEKEWLASLR